MPQRPPNLDASGRPVGLASVRPPDLDAAGQPEVQTPRSLGGFAQHVVTSGLTFGQNMATGMAAMVNPPSYDRGIRAVIEMARQPTLTGNLLLKGLNDRYGSLDAILNTAYTDPVGMAADLSMVLGGVTLAARAAGAPVRATSALTGIADALNPLKVPSLAGETAGRGLYAAGLNPPKVLRREFPGTSLTGYTANALPTEAGIAKAKAALGESSDVLHAKLTAAETAGSPRVTAAQIIPAYDGPIAKARLRARAGLSEEATALEARKKLTSRRLAFGQSLTDANAVKQEAQSLAASAFRAQQKGALVSDLDLLATENVAQAYRRAIEENAASVGVTDIAESNKKTQALIGLAKALEDASHRPTGLRHLAAVAETITQGPVKGALMAMGTGTKTMMRTGLAVGKSSRQLRHAQVVRALAAMYGAAHPDEEQP